MHRVITCLLLTSALCLAGCGSDDTDLPTAPVDTIPALTKDDSVLANCELVRAAAEAFALDNGGMYPETKWTAGSNGKYLIDYLPGGMPLRNPYAGDFHEPVDGESWVEGETGYLSVHDDAGDPTGYIVTGTGAQGGRWIYRYENIPPPQP